MMKWLNDKYEKEVAALSISPCGFYVRQTIKFFRVLFYGILGTVGIKLYVALKEGVCLKGPRGLFPGNKGFDLRLVESLGLLRPTVQYLLTEFFGVEFKIYVFKERWA